MFLLCSQFLDNVLLKCAVAY